MTNMVEFQEIDQRDQGVCGRIIGDEDRDKIGRRSPTKFYTHQNVTETKGF